MSKFKVGDIVKVRPLVGMCKIVTVHEPCNVGQMYTYVKDGGINEHTAYEQDISLMHFTPKPQFTIIPDQPSAKLVTQLALEFVANVRVLNTDERTVILDVIRKGINPLVYYPAVNGIAAQVENVNGKYDEFGTLFK